MKILTLTSMIALATLAIGCAHQASHGTVAMKTTDTVAHISIHNVKSGQPVVLYRNVCSGSGGGRGEARLCRREQIAEGKITNVLSEHYSEAQFPAGIKFAEGDFVETVR